MKLLRLTNFLLCCFLAWACQNDSVDPTSYFSKIYDNNEFDQVKAVSIRQTADGGYVVLGTLSNSGLANDLYYDIPFLMRLNPDGSVRWTTRNDNTFHKYRNPAPQLIINGNDYLFWCMEELESGGYTLTLLKISDAKRVPELVFEQPNGINAWYALPTEDKSIVLVGLIFEQNNNNSFDESAVVVKLNADYTIAWDRTYPYGESAKNPRLRELTPNYFFCTEATYQSQKVYIFNTVSQDGTQVEFKMLNAQNGNLVNKKSIGEVFPMAFSQLNDNIFMGAFTNLRDIDLNSNFNWEQEQNFYSLDRIFHELSLGNRIIIKSNRVKNRDIRILVATTKNLSIITYIWGEVKNVGYQVLGRLYLGASNVYKAADFMPTQDGGMIVVGTTIVTDRFDRICVFKLSKEQLENLVPNN